LEIEGFRFPDDLYYSVEHFWGRVEDSLVTEGATDFTQQLAGEILYIELPRKGRKVEQGKPFTSVESGKWVGRVYAVVSGEIVDVNEQLEDEPTLINRDPYGAGWIVKIKPSDSTELTKLMRSTDPGFRQWLLDEIQKHKRT